MLIGSTTRHTYASVSAFDSQAAPPSIFPLLLLRSCSCGRTCGFARPAANSNHAELGLNACRAYPLRLNVPEKRKLCWMKEYVAELEVQCSLQVFTGWSTCAPTTACLSVQKRPLILLLRGRSSDANLGHQGKSLRWTAQALDCGMVCYCGRGKGRTSSTQQTVTVSATQAKHDCGNTNTQGTWRDAPLSLICEAIMSE